MAEIPESWGLKKKRRQNDGRIDIVGKDDTGNEYTALTTETENVTETDVAALARGDRETSDARKFTEHFVEAHERNKAEFEDKVMEEDFEVMESVMRDVYRRSPRLCGVPAGPTRVSLGGFSHRRSRCHFGGCDWCHE